MPCTIAYLPVSSLNQNLEKNKADILHLSNDKHLGKVEFIEEKISWKQSEIGPLLEELKKGDTIFY